MPRPNSLDAEGPPGKLLVRNGGGHELRAVAVALQVAKVEVRVGDAAFLEVNDRKQRCGSTIPHLVVAEITMDKNLRRHPVRAVEDVINALGHEPRSA